ncbi:MAG: 2-hydroxyhepta-2,4-diene-1,7-dioate isomerase [Marinilabiliales bacterium]|nr:MAG: 2-hydroxyhepta-2,4-diene-1,7-dioate isomerase [Marinilabiliales bacterium]
MKIICIGRNYLDHIKEMNNEVPEYPVFFMKSENALYHKNLPFFIPDFSKNIHYELELVIKICKTGKNIEEKFAHTYFDAVTVGLDLTARDLQKECIQNGEPWEKAKSFDFSAPLGEFIDLKDTPYPASIKFSLEKNGEIVQNGDSKNMVFDFRKIIAHVSKYNTLKTGDLIYTGTPAGVGQLNKGDKLIARIESKELLSLDVK